MLWVMNYLFPLAAIMCNTQKKCKVLNKQSAKSFHLIFEHTVVFVYSHQILGHSSAKAFSATCKIQKHLFVMI